VSCSKPLSGKCVCMCACVYMCGCFGGHSEKQLIQSKAAEGQFREFELYTRGKEEPGGS
jgi:hypothetical protein